MKIIKKVSFFGDFFTIAQNEEGKFLVIQTAEDLEVRHIVEFAKNDTFEFDNVQLIRTISVFDSASQAFLHFVAEITDFTYDNIALIEKGDNDLSHM